MSSRRDGRVPVIRVIGRALCCWRRWERWRAVPRAVRLCAAVLALLTIPAVAARTFGPRGSIVQLKATGGCYVAANRLPNGCATATGTRGVYTVALSRDGRDAYAPAQDSEGIS